MKIIAPIGCESLQALEKQDQNGAMASADSTVRSGATLDLILKSLISTPDFNDLQKKNWEAISRLIPGTTAHQCARRYDELLASEGGLSVVQGKPPPVSQPTMPTSIFEPDLSARTAKQKSAREDTDRSENKTMNSRELANQGPVMVIHVCDEAKNLKKDFNCPRDLLVSEMKYFAEYLTSDAQRWEEVDISVHCDVQIFDWLMKYVKRGTREYPEKPRLESNNVVSILISSDFLKMDNLVTECIQYCHKNMTAIVGTNCNMNCINEKLVTRIAELFSHNEADEIKDRKDKFKSKLFSKKLEKLFDPDYSSPDSPESAATLFRCSVCKRVLTRNMERKVKCLPSRMTIDRHGQLVYCHIRDPSFDVNDYLIELKSQVKSWRDVYWRIWGSINTLHCSRCEETFPLTELNHCRYHPEPPRFENEPGTMTTCVGVHPCCNQSILRFDPVQLNRGCRVKDHIVNLAPFRAHTSGDCDVVKSPQQRVYDDLLAHRDLICVPYQRPSEGSDCELNVFANEVFASHSRTSGISIPFLTGDEDGKNESKPQPRLQALTVARDVTYVEEDCGFGESDDEIGDEESQKSVSKKPRGTRKSRVTIEPQAILLDAPEFEQKKKSTWDVQRSMRYNQDAQRQEDQRRMNEIKQYLVKLRMAPEKVDKPKKEYAGGIFCKLESQWKATNAPQQNSKAFGPGQNRGRPRFPQLRTSVS